MSIKNEINSFEFQSLNSFDAEIIKNGLFDYANLLNEDEAVDCWIDNAGVLEDIIDEQYSQPETMSEILEILNPFERLAEDEVMHIFEAIRFEEISSYYETNPFLVTMIEILHKNIPESFDLESFFTELAEICVILSKSY
jgi:hypothetical protein